MKLSIRALITGSLLLGSNLAGPFGAAAAAKANADCYLTVSRLELEHGCIYIEGRGPGACEMWSSIGPIFHGTLTRTSTNHYQMNNAELGVRANVLFDGKTQAQISIQAPGGVKQSQIVGLSYDNFDTAHQFPNASSHASFRDAGTQTGLDYEVSCSFGLSDAVNSQEAAATARMNELGPAQEWMDPSAASVEALPIGTILEVTKDMDINPGSETGLTKFVEQNGLMTEAGFGKLELPYRFAFADIFNANNLYLQKTHYPKGMRLQVTQVVMNSFASGGHSFTILLKLVGLPESYSGAVDPITRIAVTGRRSGLGDIKIPQLAALLSPFMRLQN